MKRQPGVYLITNKVSGHRYVGSSVNMTYRWNKHRKQLSLGTHHNIPLQRAWDKYGSDAFEMTILCECEADVRTCQTHEQHFIDILHPEYNTSVYATGGSNPGSTWSPTRRERIVAALTGHPVTEETKEKLRIAKTGKKLGPHSEETKNKIRRANSHPTHPLSESTKQKLREINSHPTQPQPQSVKDKISKTLKERNERLKKEKEEKND